VADTGSTNGTYINGRRIAYGEWGPVEEGDVLALGDLGVGRRKRSQIFDIALFISALLLLQTPTPTPVPTVPERMPALFTLIYVGGLGFVVLLLLVGLLRNRKRPI